MSERYAIYFVPREDSLLWRLGCEWHGRDPASGERFSPHLPQMLTAKRYEEIVAPARRYGFHATLKPPFALKPGTKAQELEAAIEAHAKRIAPFAAPALQLARIGGFLALMLSAKSPAMDRLCADCVRVFDHFRSPATKAELAARRKAPLSPRQDELLKVWGYPFVMDEFRFHMTLTASLEGEELDQIQAHLRERFRAVLAAPLYVDRIALFREDSPGADFELVRSFAFGARGQPAVEEDSSAAIAAFLARGEPTDATLTALEKQREEDASRAMAEPDLALREDKLDEASRESMDASDPPGYYNVRAGGPGGPQKKRGGKDR